MEIPLPKPLPKQRTAQGHTEPIDTQNLLLETVLPFREMRPSSTEMNTSSPQPGSRHRTLVQAHPLGANSTTKKNKHFENFFLLNHSFYSSYILRPLCWLFAELWIFPFFFKIFSFLFCNFIFFNCSFPAVAIP